MLIAGNSLAGVMGGRLDIVKRHGFDAELQCWPDHNLSGILENLHSLVRPYHELIILCGVTFEAWNYVSLLQTSFEPRIVYPNPNFKLYDIYRHLIE